MSYFNPYETDAQAAAAEVAADSSKVPAHFYYKLGAKAVLAARDFIERHDLGGPIGIGAIGLGTFLLHKTGLLDGVSSLVGDHLTQFTNAVIPDILPLGDIERSQVYPEFQPQPIPSDMLSRSLPQESGIPN